MDINHRIAARVRALREGQGWSLEALAERCGVSRSNISLIERGQSSPTATVLDKLSAGLGVTVASLFEPPEADAAPSPLARAAGQPVWTDPGSGYRRRNLSPASWPAPLQLVEVRFPAGQQVQFDTADRPQVVHQQIWLISGQLQLQLGDEAWTLAAGDCLAMTLDRPTRFHNPGPGDAHYLVALSTTPTPGAAPRRTTA